jgi:predicted GH43/DUF377 family glycosyl hydrolase
MIKVKKEFVLVKPSDIKPSHNSLEVLGTFNPAAARLKNGNIILYVRILEKLKITHDDNYFYAPRLVGDDRYILKIDKFKKDLVKNYSNLDIVFKDDTKRLAFISHFRRVLLDNSGLRVIEIDDKPSFYGVSWDGELGVEDPRITKINDLYVMSYVNLSREDNISTSLAISKNGYHWHRRGIIFREQNKDVVFFPELIDKKYVAFDRPEGSFQFSPPHIWISYSGDLEYWGKSKSVIFSKKNEWDSGRVGAGPPPIKIDRGWLFIYHGTLSIKHRHMIHSFYSKIKNFFKSLFKVYKEADEIYCVGIALFDLNDPETLITKSKTPILYPRKKYESGTFENKKVIFPTGLVIDNNPKYVLLYSGAGDHVTTVRKISLHELMKSLEDLKD